MPKRKFSFEKKQTVQQHLAPGFTLVCHTDLQEIMRAPNETMNFQKKEKKFPTIVSAEFSNFPQNHIYIFQEKSDPPSI